MHVRSGFWLSIVWTAIICLLLLQINTGIADNGDFDRSVGWLLEKPIGFSSNTPPPGSAEWADRYFYRWHPEWEYRGQVEWMPYSVTSYQLLLIVGWLVNQAAGSAQFSLIVAGVVSRIVLLATILLLARHLFDRSWPLWAAAIAFIFLDSRYIAFLNSFYQEHASILFFFLLLLALARLATRGKGRDIFFLGLALLLFSTSKVQLVFTPLVLLIAWTGSQGLGNRKSRATALVLVAVQLLASPLLLHNKFSAHNQFNALFNGALYFDRGRFPDWLSPELKECIGVPAWSRDPDCLGRLGSAVDVHQVVNAYADNPLALLKGIDYGMRNLNRIDLAPYYSLETNNLPSFHAAGIVNVWNRVKRLGAGFPVYFELSFILAVAVFCRGTVPHLSFLALFLFGFVLSQVGVSIVGEGRVDIEKHLLIANAALDLAAMISVNIFYRTIRGAAVTPNVSPFARIATS